MLDVPSEEVAVTHRRAGGQGCLVLIGYDRALWSEAVALACGLTILVSGHAVDPSGPGGDHVFPVMVL